MRDTLKHYSCFFHAVRGVKTITHGNIFNIDLTFAETEIQIAT